MSESFDLNFGKSFWMISPNNPYIDVEIIMNDAIFQADDLCHSISRRWDLKFSGRGRLHR